MSAPIVTAGYYAGAVRCPDCAAAAVPRVDCDGYEILVCPTDDCPRIIVALLIQPEPVKP